MSPRNLIVLKFGGSVLKDTRSLRRAVHEIHRWRRESFQVVAVVSALAGTTERLLDCCERLTAGASTRATASVLAGGERHSAALLGLLLDRAGVPARVMAPEAIDLIAEGPALDADPISLDEGPILHALDQGEVVVVPGFAALDEEQRTVVLGRGGSDLTALFLAQRLRASRCRLVKDVDGLYESDPAAPGPSPARYDSASWNDALGTDGSILQHKAVLFARDHGLEFEVAGVNGTGATRVGSKPTRKSLPPDSLPPLRVALLGLGTVGAGLHDLLRGLPQHFDVARVLVRDRERKRQVQIEPSLLTEDPELDFEDVDVVIETLGGTEVAKNLVERALDQGAHVVTANKTLLAEHGQELARKAKARGLELHHSAAVGGCLPLLEQLSRQAGQVQSIRGVLNGTVNFLLDGFAQGRRHDERLIEAREQGFAESDASRDLEGLDAADKLVVIAQRLGWTLQPEQVLPEALSAEHEGLALRAAQAGRRLRQVSKLALVNGTLRAKVEFDDLESSDPLAKVDGESNAVVVETRDGRAHLLLGKGAGRWPTAESLLGDLLDLTRTRSIDTPSKLDLENGSLGHAI